MFPFISCPGLTKIFSLESGVSTIFADGDGITFGAAEADAAPEEDAAVDDSVADDAGVLADAVV